MHFAFLQQLKSFPVLEVKAYLKHHLPCSLMHCCKEKYPSNGLLSLVHGAPNPGCVSMAHINVPLHGQGQGEPENNKKDYFKQNTDIFIKLLY